MSKKDGDGCSGCLGILVVLTFFGSMIFGGGVWLKIGGLGISLGGDSLNRSSTTVTNLTELENSKKVADESSQKFRVQIEQGQCKDAYDRASEIFKKNLSYAQMMVICENAKQNLGSIGSVQLTDWWEQPINGESGRYILLRYMTKFSKYTVREAFVWQVKDSKADLINYEVFPLSMPTNESLLIHPEI